MHPLHHKMPRLSLLLILNRILPVLMRCDQLAKTSRRHRYQRHLRKRQQRQQHQQYFLPNLLHLLHMSPLRN